MTKNSAAPGSAQVQAGRAMLAIVGVATITALVLNVKAGLEQSPEAAVIYGMADAALVVVAATATVNRHTLLSIAALAACAMLSLTCQITAHLSNASHQYELAADHNAKLARARAKLEEAKANARAGREKAAKAQADADSIHELGLVPDLEKEAGKAARIAEGEAKAARKAKKRCQDHEGCSAAVLASSAITERLGKARSRAASQGQAEAAEAKAAEFDIVSREVEAEIKTITPAKIDGAAKVLSAWLGMDEATAALNLSTGRTGALLAVTLLLQLLGGYAWETMSKGVEANRAAGTASVEIGAALPTASEADETPSMEKLLDLLARADEEYQMELDMMAMVEALETPTSTVEVASEIKAKVGDKAALYKERARKAAATRAANKAAKEKAEREASELAAAEIEAKTTRNKERAAKAAATKKTNKQKRLGGMRGSLRIAASNDN
jgi:hypothetical protein